MSSDALRIGLNATTLLSPLTGIGQYTRSLAGALAAMQDIEVHLFYGTGWSRSIRTAPLKDITRAKRLFKAIIPRPYMVSRLLAQPNFTRGANARNLGIYHEPGVLPYDFDGPTAITVHDLSWIRFPNAHPKQRVEAMNRLFPRALDRSDHVITDAQFVRDEIIRDFGFPAARITSIPLAARQIFKPRSGTDCEAMLASLSLSYRHFILCVGTLEPRKNLEFVVKTYAAMPEAVRWKWPLVIVGMKGWLASSLQSLMQPLTASGQIRALGFLPDADLAMLYASARMLVYPSLYEGFGLPPLEAMASGTPVIVSNRSTLPEVVGSAGLLIDPSDSDALAAKIMQLIDDEQAWQDSAAASLIQAEKFSWSRCAAETVAVYRKVLQ